MNNEFTVNLNGVNSYVLNNDKRMISFFKENSELPIVIHIDNRLNIADEVLRRQKEDPRYQGTNSEEITKAILEDMAREQESFEETRKLEGYDTSHISDVDKLKKISALLKEAGKENALLPRDEQFAYIDEENNCIMSKTGKVLEAVVVNGELVVRTPEGSIKFKDQELGHDEAPEENKDDIAYDTPVNDEVISDREIDEVYEEIFTKGGVDESKKQEIVENIRKTISNPDLIESMPEDQKEWYYSAYDMVKSKKKKLILAPKDNEQEKQAGNSNGLLIAIVVLFIVFAVFMYIVFRR